MFQLIGLREVIALWFSYRWLWGASNMVKESHKYWQSRLKWIKPTDALSPSFTGKTTLHVSGSLSAHHQEFWAVHWLWYIICSGDDRMLPGVGWHPTPGSIRSPQLHIMYQSRCTAKNSWWWAEWLPETCIVVILIKLGRCASVDFIHFNLLRCTVIPT